MLAQVGEKRSPPEKQASASPATEQPATGPNVDSTAAAATTGPCPPPIANTERVLPASETYERAINEHDELLQQHPSVLAESCGHAWYVVVNRTRGALRFEAEQVHSRKGKLIQLLADTAPPCGEAIIYDALECSGGHMRPSNFFQSFRVFSQDSRKVLYRGVRNADWVDGGSSWVLTIE